jgi:predicted DNA-binding transcriptional regulator YafY
MLPPLMFSDEEIEALVLGVRWVAVDIFAIKGCTATRADC